MAYSAIESAIIGGRPRASRNASVDSSANSKASAYGHRARPRDHLDAERMQREQQRGRSRDTDTSRQATREREHQHRTRGVKTDVQRVRGRRSQCPQTIDRAPCEPRERLIVLDVGRRERPAKKSRRVERRVADEDLLIVPVQKWICERPREQKDDRDADGATNDEQTQPRWLKGTKKDLLLACGFVLRAFVISCFRDFVVSCPRVFVVAFSSSPGSRSELREPLASPAEPERRDPA